MAQEAATGVCELFKRLFTSRRGRRNRSGGSRFSRLKWSISDAPFIAILLSVGMGFWFMDPSSTFITTPAWAMPTRFISSEMALPNFLKVVCRDGSASRVLDLADLDASGISGWGGPIEEYDFADGSTRSQADALALSRDRSSTYRNNFRNNSGLAGNVPGTPHITSGFGFRTLSGATRHHDGIDIAIPYGSPIKAKWGGEVVFADWYSGYGLAVIINHGQGKESLYAHASSLRVRAGDIVRAEDIIAYVGTTGRSFGPHLHFEVRYDNVAVDPEEEYLR